MEFNSTLARFYTLEFCENLASNVWNTASNNIPGTGENMAIPLDKTHPASFYRVKVRMAE